jgi:hypothetical protein
LQISYLSFSISWGLGAALAAFTLPPTSLDAC